MQDFTNNLVPPQLTARSHSFFECNTHVKIHSTFDALNQVPPYIFFFFDNPYHLDVSHSTEENICCYVHFIAALIAYGNRPKKIWMGIWVISGEGNWSIRLACSNTRCRSFDNCQILECSCFLISQLCVAGTLRTAFPIWFIPQLLGCPYVASYWGYEAPPIASPQHMPKLWH